MSKNDQVNSSHPRRSLQDQTGPPEWWAAKLSKVPKHWPSLEATLVFILSKVPTKVLEENGILTRTIHDAAPISVVYELTYYGRTLDKVVLELRNWGIEHRRQVIG